MKHLNFFRYLENESATLVNSTTSSPGEASSEEKGTTPEYENSVINISETTNENIKGIIKAKYKTYFPKLHRASLSLDIVNSCSDTATLKQRIQSLGIKDFEPYTITTKNATTTYQLFLLENSDKNKQYFTFSAWCSNDKAKTFDRIKFDGISYAFKGTPLESFFGQAKAASNSRLFYTPYTFVVLIEKEEAGKSPEKTFRFFPVQLEYNSIVRKFTAVKFSRTQDIPDYIIKVMDNLLIKNISTPQKAPTQKANTITKGDKGSINPISITWTDTQRSLVLSLLQYALSMSEKVRRVLKLGGPKSKGSLVVALKNPKVKAVSSISSTNITKSSMKEKNFKVADRLLTDDASLGIDELFFMYTFDISTNRTIEENPMLLEELEKELTEKLIENKSSLEEFILGNNKITYGYYTLKIGLDFQVDNIKISKIKNNLFSVELPIIATKIKTKERVLPKLGRGAFNVLLAADSSNKDKK